MGCNKIRVFIILKKRKLRLNSKFREKRNEKNKGEGEEGKGRVNHIGSNLGSFAISRRMGV